MKADAWEGGHRMPFIARWPTTIEPGSSSDQTISFCDLLATFADLVGTELPKDAGPDSFSFLSLLMGEDKEIRPSLAVEAGKDHMSFRAGHWKLITGKGSGGFSQRGQPMRTAGPDGQLYNLKEDIGEQNNLYDKHPEIVQRLLERLQSYNNTHCGGSRCQPDNAGGPLGMPSTKEGPKGVPVWFPWRGDQRPNSCDTDRSRIP